MKESPLGVALKTVNRNKTNIPKMIRICDTCSTPLIWTFVFSYCERYCLNCGNKGGMMGFGTDVPATKDLIFQKKMVDAIWSVIYGKKGLLPNGPFGKHGCKKCTSSDRHNTHLSETEKEWNKIASEWLLKVRGLFNEQ